MELTLHRIAIMMLTANIILIIFLPFLVAALNRIAYILESHLEGIWETLDELDDSLRESHHLTIDNDEDDCN
jgi:hypothetical protein